MADPTGAPPGAPPAAPTGREASPEREVPVDRFGQLLARGFDLAEAGLSLGLTLVETAGGIAQNRLLGLVEQAPSARPPPPPPAPPPPAAAPHGGIANRLPLAPGAPVNVSFSINNDSPTRAWDVALSLDPFVGLHTGAPLPPGCLAVVPASARVAPMDFEKFTLRGALPPETVPDTYEGYVCVEASAGVRIPVRLVVEARQAP